MTTPSPDPDATARVDTSEPFTPYPRGPQPQFSPGTLIAGRYRIGAILGSGGMGEVYRADDVKLDQTVALKFLPARLARDPILLTRLHDEVRLGRQITHPNVCRIYDIVEADGAHFVAMEYVDGEDLSRLLRRIGRLAHDKAVDIARGIAAGLLAAHSKGILHRDLKPANVMIDSHGDARVMDFGLALAAGEHDGTVSGTPAYMAPEQLQGRPATIQSDLYALGLVMYELFTGKRAHSGRTMPERLRDIASEITTPSSVIRDLDPGVERLILRCLANDPAQRPRSAREVVEALPGGDPLAAAIAAGETPSPGMVAAAGTEGSLRPAVAWTMLAAILLLLGAIAAWRVDHSLLARYPVEKPPAVLNDRAAALLREAGVPAQPFVTGGLEPNRPYLAWLSKTDTSPTRWRYVAEGAPILFTRRESARPRTATPMPPVGGVPGTSEIVLSARGELVSLTVVPPREWPARRLDWTPLLAAAALDPSTLTPATPQLTPPVTSDARAAWTGRHPARGTPIRVEAAAWRGTPVLFRTSGPWDQLSRETVESASNFFAGPASLLITALAVLALGIALTLAWHNLRLRRGDRQGAFRVSVGIFALDAVLGVAAADHQLDSRHELELLQNVVAQALLWGVLAFIAYIALEPFVRRRWPSAIISWTRLVRGRWNDAMVGRDVLVGVAVGLLHAMVSTFSWPVAAALRGEAAGLTLTENLGPLNGARFALARLAAAVSSATTSAFVVLVLLAAITMAVRNRALAVGVIATVGLLVHGLAAGDPVIFLLATIPTIGALLFVLVRFGLVAFVAAQASFLCTFHYAIPVDVAWWTPLGLVGPGFVLALTLWAFRTSLAGQSAFGTALLDQA